MNSTAVRAKQRSRGVALTPQAVEILRQALEQWWESAEERRFSRTKKFTREMKAAALGLEMKTIDKILRREPVDEVSLKYAFDKLKIRPSFNRERYCESVLRPFGNLPHMPNLCIGRDAEIPTVCRLLEANRLVTLTGTAGVGKTRLAIQVGEEAQSRFAAGVWFVDLADLSGASDQTQVFQTVAVALGVREEAHRPLIQTLADYLRTMPLLLILDNCEHLLPSCATLVHALLSASATLRIVATSREGLNIPFERPFIVSPLAVPEQQQPSGRVFEYDSVRLFLARVAVIRPDLTVTDGNAPLLARICRRLDGIPLALELAAGRMSSLPLDVLERELAGCLQLLTGGSRTALPRHQTLRAAMDWSYHLLNEPERALLRRLSVFAGGVFAGSGRAGLYRCPCRNRRSHGHSRLFDQKEPGALSGVGGRGALPPPGDGATVWLGTISYQRRVRHGAEAAPRLLPPTGRANRDETGRRGTGRVVSAIGRRKGKFAGEPGIDTSEE